MYKITINGNKTLTGEIKISGSKNSAVALIPAAVLCDEEVTIANVPNISDIDALDDILNFLGAKVYRNEDIIKIDSKNITNRKIPKEIATKLRASYYFMGAMLSKFKRVEIYFPGGCSIGARPINLHLKGFEAMGAKVEENNNLFTITADELKGAKINLEFASVGATLNLMLAAVKAKGTTIISNAAKEPHIVNVATFLNNMGAKITGAGTSEIKIEGVDYLHSCFHEVVPDYIETGTYMILASIIGDKLKISNIIPDHVESLISKLEDVGAIMEIGVDFITISRPKKLKATNIKTQVYPGFPTDLQQPMATLLTQANGKSIINETIWENRFLNLKELNKMGATTDLLTNQKAVIIGPTKLTGKRIKATDLRGAASLLIAGLIASGTTVIENADYILRGYEDIVYKLTNVGADIKLEKEG
ncbi:MAG: UDP-N-acetylglucosamine 1-carboxyvinyltransferase [Tenericutes bacterium]|nr:UDP-N-acetylglucosamine 1-carboxyvinyltransferase [Mycoplasmatota bacterium]